MTAPVSEGTSAEEAAEAVYSALDQLDQSGTNWVHHPSHFLPANVTTDGGGDGVGLRPEQEQGGQDLAVRRLLA